ncbi:MAG: hypothetical protein V2J20_10840 [Wenzhouxiangella sp.]|jgi:hypothetical protein|nr:hypothetical protein [Wenzhouxiangella sp.]
MLEPHIPGLAAPLFAQAIGDLDPEQRVIVLDLGNIRSGTVELFATYRCRLDIANLPDVLPLPGVEDDPDVRSRVLASVLTVHDREPLDLVLCWNLLNYLDREDIRQLIELLAPRLKAGTRLHALMEYASPLMPATPGAWVPDTNGRLHASQVDEEQTDSPRYKPKELERLMPQLKPERTVLLGNGLQEFLFKPR